MSRPLGAPNLRDVEIDAIIRGVKKRLSRVQSKDIGMMHLYELVAEETGFDAKTVYRVWRMMQPTTGLAVDFIRARAFKLARKIVQDASVSEAMDILSRPNIGVLEPIKKGPEGGGGFFISVSADSCGAVNVGIGAAQPQAALPPAEEKEGEVFDAVMWNEGGEPQDERRSLEASPLEQKRKHGGQPGERGPGKSLRFQQAVEEVKKKLEKRKIYKGWYQNKKAKRLANKNIDTPEESL